MRARNIDGLVPLAKIGLAREVQRDGFKKQRSLIISAYLQEPLVIIGNVHLRANDDAEEKERSIRTDLQHLMEVGADSLLMGFGIVSQSRSQLLIGLRTCACGWLTHQIRL